MVYFHNLVEGLKLLKDNWRIFIPSLFGFFITLLLSIIFISLNDLFPVILRDPSALFVSGGISEIVSKVSSVLITKSQLLKILITLAGFIITNFFVGSGLIAMKYSMIDDALRKKKLSLRKSFFGGSKFYWKIIEMRVMVFVLIIVLSLLLSLPLSLISSLFGQGFIIALSVILIVLLTRLLLLFRYPVLIRDNKRAIPALIKSMDMFKSKTKYTVKVWLISLIILFIVAILVEVARIFVGDLFYGLYTLPFILMGLYVVKELVVLVVNLVIDTFVFVSYIKRKKK